MVTDVLTPHAYVAPSEGGACEVCAYETGAAVHHDGVPELPESPSVPEDTQVNPDATSATTIEELGAQVQALKSELAAVRDDVVDAGQIPFDIDLSAEASLKRQLENEQNGRFPYDDLPSPARFVHVTVSAAGGKRLLVYNVYQTVEDAQANRGAFWGGKDRGWYVIYKWLSDMGIAPITA